MEKSKFFLAIIILLFIHIICWIFFYVLADDFIQSIGSDKYPLYYGKIINKEAIKFYGIKRSKVFVKMDDSDLVLYAVLYMDGVNDIPDKVSFHYSGDKNKEIFLLEETNSIIGAIFFGISPIFLWCYAIYRFKKPCR